MRNRTISMLLALLVMSVITLQLGCKKDDTPSGGGGGTGGGLTANPTSISVQVGQQATATISGGRPPYSIQTAPTASVATAAISGATLTVSGIGAGSASVTVRDSSGAATVSLPISVTTPGGGSGSASFTLNGGPFNNRTSTLTEVRGAYIPADRATGIYGRGISGSDSVYLYILFMGNQTGTFPWTDSTGVALLVGTGTTALGYESVEGRGQVVVTAYGSVGGNITGTFSGRMFGGGAAGADSVTVSNGSFSAVRLQ